MQALASSSRVAGTRPNAPASICRIPMIAAPRMLGGALSHDLAPSGRSAQPSTARCPERLITRVAAAEQSIDLDLDDQGVSAAVDAVIRYAINLAKASETYEVHSWMVLLGILKYESCAAAQILKKLGLEDLYGAWNEVLWALHVCDGLQRRAFCTEVKFADRAFKVITGASDFAEWHGKDKMYTEDLLMALAAGGVLEGLFPDLNLSFDRVRKVVEKHTGRTYALPDEEPSGEERGPLKSEDDVSFL